ncbi:MAG: hypothetical protein ACRDVW_10240 [Acidimicrobiales bacterium]
MPSRTAKATAASQHELLGRVRAEASACSGEPYLLTVSAEGRPHCVVVAVVDWERPDGHLVVPAPSSWAGSATRGRRQVTLLWPPSTAGGYSLIVDGLASDLECASASASASAALVAVAPTRAVLHRPGRGAPGVSSCGSDCVPIFGP